MSSDGKAAFGISGILREDGPHHVHGVVLVHSQPFQDGDQVVVLGFGAEKGMEVQAKIFAKHILHFPEKKFELLINFHEIFLE